MFVAPDCKKLCYSGRIDHMKKEAPVLVYPCSYVKIRFTGNSLAFYAENYHGYWDNYIGYILDGKQGKIKLQESGRQKYALHVISKKSGLQEDIYEDMQEEVYDDTHENIYDDTHEEIHECMLFKRMDACHYVVFYGFELQEGGEVLDLPMQDTRRMEFYGDSVSAGEVSEACAYTGKEDPVHQGEFSNSWYSYAWMTARKLNAQIHNISQGGIALLRGTGWFCEPEYVGMEQIYDKIEYHPQLGESRLWDFSAYVPHVVVIAIGQNDSHPHDYMAEDPHGAQAQIWKEHYAQFVRTIREKYPKAVIILATTILEHDAHWDEAIAQVCGLLQDDRICHFLYSQNGCGTPGHIRIPEAEQMAEELSAFIRGLGEEIWDEKA